jgi:hypothetical protein
VPASLLQGLHELVKETEKSDMLTGLYENSFPSWLRKLIERVNACKRIASIYENNAHFDAVLALVSASLLSGEEGCYKKNAQKAMEKGLDSLVADILNESTWE